METINGYAVIADRPHETWAGRRVILAVRDRDESVTGRFAYVVAVTAPRDESPTSWDHGDYSTSLIYAARAFNLR